MLRVVGRLVVPRLAWQGAHEGQAAGLTMEGLRVLDPRTLPEGVFVRYRAGVDAERAAEEMKRALGPTVAVLSRRVPAQLHNLARVKVVPLALAGVTGLLGLLTLIHALVTAVRRRGRDLAILKCLGFTRRQMRAAIASQATIMTVGALAFAIPAGIAAGRWAWGLFGDRTGFIPQPVVPLVVAITLVPGTLLLANLIASGPGGAAARAQPAVALRTE